MTHRLVRLTVLGALVWDYTGTVLELAAQVRPPDTKAVSREIHGLRLGYDRSRSRFFDDDLSRTLVALSLQFEEVCRQVLADLNKELPGEPEFSGLAPEMRYLVQGTQVAMTVLDALMMYAAECDRWMTSLDVKGYTMLSDEFRRLAGLLPRYAAGCYNPASPARRKAAGLLLDELRLTEVYDTDNNKKIDA